MAAPIASPPLSALATGKRSCTVIISDHTHPVPCRDILPEMLSALREGNPDIDITLLVATGFHRPSTAQELEQKLGKEILAREKIVVHDAFDPSSNVDIGGLPSGARLVIDRLAVETDLLVSEGFIEPHFFAGFSGGRKSVLPGVEFLRPYCEVTAVPADIVITSNGGAPLDQNIYQCVKGLSAAEASAKEGAVLILCASLTDGHGGEGFYQSLKECKSPAAHFAQCIATPQSDTIPDQWESQILARILMKHRVIFVSRPEMRRMLEDMKMECCTTLEEAVSLAKEEKGEHASVTVIPNGISVIVKSNGAMAGKENLGMR